MESAFEIGLLVIVVGAWGVPVALALRKLWAETGSMAVSGSSATLPVVSFEMGDNDVQQQLNELRSDVSNVKLQVAKVEGEVRIVKHDQANMKMGFDGFAQRSEKTQDGMKADLKEIIEKVSALNVRQEKGTGFYAGVAASITVCSGFILFLVKQLFGAHG